jgi:hypothetical protein
LVNDDNKYKYRGYWGIAKVVTYILLLAYFFGDPDKYKDCLDYAVLSWLLALEHLILSK